MPYDAPPAERAEEILRALAEAARAAGRDVLLETEGYALVRSLGLGVPVHEVVTDADEAAILDLRTFPSDRLVVKVLSPQILHKSDVGGVRVVKKSRAALVAAIEELVKRFKHDEVCGFSVNEFVTHEATLGSELLLGMRYTEDFGPVVTFGPGGIYAEHLSSSLRPERDVAILSPRLQVGDSPAASLGLQEVLVRKMITPIVTGRLRGQRPLLPMPDLLRLVESFLELARRAMPETIGELEVNPLVLTGRGPVALDAFVRLGRTRPPEPAPRPMEKIGRLLRPLSIAVVGVSRKENPGRLILRNILASGFPRDRVWVVKEGEEPIEGCALAADVAALPEPVDLMVVAVDAGQVPGVVGEVLATQRAESLILIPGGLGERHGSEVHVERLRVSLEAARGTRWHGPVLNGGNCLGVRSEPGRYDTLFIPHHKLRFPPTVPEPLAVLSQSGAFAIARSSKLPALNPRYLVTFGNQVDLTVGDYLTYLKDDPEVEVFACYVEGFRPGDGGRFLDAAAEITASGRPVILYRAGRTHAGAAATASHTASIAGDYVVTRELARAAGVVVAETLQEFEELVALFCFLRGSEVRGFRLGALSNAGFECVAIADNLGRFRLAEWSEETVEGLAALLGAARLDSIVAVRNPLDVTPILGDEAFAEAARLVLDDPGVDVGLVGCVPLTGALRTVAEAEAGEDFEEVGSVVRRLAELRTTALRPWVAVVDSGPLYDPMACHLERHRIPVFRTADRALGAFETFCRFRIGKARDSV